jgi:N-acylneuraminate cytidylyltransferase
VANKPIVDAMVLARGGSVRLQRKNLLPFCGKPLVAWTLLQARSAERIRYVWLVTDDEEIASVGHQYGANIIYQPTKDCQHGSMGGAFATYWCLRQIERMDKLPQAMMNMFPTNPLRQPGDMDRVIRRHFEMGHCRTVGAVRLADMSLYTDMGDGLIRATVFDKSGGVLVENGAFAVHSLPYYLRIAKFQIDHADDLQAVGSIGIDYAYYEMPVWTFNDIDTLDDFQMAEALFKGCILQQYGEDCYERNS